MALGSIDTIIHRILVWRKNEQLLGQGVPEEKIRSAEIGFAVR